jgi:hypothetical protein
MGVFKLSQDGYFHIITKMGIFLKHEEVCPGRKKRLKPNRCSESAAKTKQV